MRNNVIFKSMYPNVMVDGWMVLTDQVELLPSDEAWKLKLELCSGHSRMR